MTNTISDGSRTETFPYGIGSVGLQKVVRRIPAGEPPALPVNPELKVIGKSVPRHDGREKVTGAIRYTVDIALPGMLYGRILRSSYPHAAVRNVDVSMATRHPGVRAVLVVTSPDVHGSSIVRYVGAPVAAVAAVSQAAADEALRLIDVDYEPLSFVVDLDDARAPDAPALFDKESAPRSAYPGVPGPEQIQLEGNVWGPASTGRGDVAQGFSRADVTLEAEYRTQVQTHCCMEPHAIVADWRMDGLTVYMSTQFTAGVRHELAETFGLPLSRVRVVVDGMGGGFGSKTMLGTYGRIAVGLSRRARAPVRLVHERAEEQMDTGNRPGTWQRLRIGARRDGSLTAISLLSYGTAGVALGGGVGNVADALYICSNVETTQYDVFTNGGPGCAMRAPGNVQGAWAMEQSIDDLAERLSIDPLVLRDHIDASLVRREERRIGAERIGWQRRRAPGADAGPVKRGLGMAQSIWGANVQTNSSCEVRVLRDGSVEVLSSVQDIGTGITTVLAQVVAEVMGLRPADVAVRIGDTDFPAGPPSHGSRTTASITPPARTAAWRVLRMLFESIAPALEAGPD
ncbi:MAG TPA: molybdopterin cofactor-binding domain-containing protein, partial [Steroidobacteraceae bacterium]|nr:molybdopterin cofactor-binding domain-containing protein [Steroidobacteraceae bacterium]